MRSRVILAVATVAVVVGVAAVALTVSRDRVDTGDDLSATPVAVCAESAPDCGEAPASGGLIVDGGLDIPAAIAYDGEEVVAVRGYFVSLDGEARLCELLAESFPPQCGGASVVITNPGSLPYGDFRQQGGTRWSEAYISVIGHIVGAELTVASNVSG